MSGTVLSPSIYELIESSQIIVEVCVLSYFTEEEAQRGYDCPRLPRQGAGKLGLRPNIQIA
jgi:hypothetical protein